jgi:hypothetical protein
MNKVIINTTVFSYLRREGHYQYLNMYIVGKGNYAGKKNVTVNIE